MTSGEEQQQERRHYEAQLEHEITEPDQQRTDGQRARFVNGYLNVGDQQGAGSEAKGGHPK